MHYPRPPTAPQGQPEQGRRHGRPPSLHGPQQIPSGGGQPFPLTLPCPSNGPLYPSLPPSTPHGHNIDLTGCPRLHDLKVPWANALPYVWMVALAPERERRGKGSSYLTLVTTLRQRPSITASNKTGPGPQAAEAVLGLSHATARLRPSTQDRSRNPAKILIRANLHIVALRKQAHSV